jgi:hypothetical protein
MLIGKRWLVVVGERVLKFNMELELAKGLKFFSAFATRKFDKIAPVFVIP